MTPEAVTTVARETIYALLWVSVPLMLVALIVGLVIALFQALTSIQEATLTFVPKIIIVLLAMLVAMPIMATNLQTLTDNLFSRMLAKDLTPENGAGDEDASPGGG